MGRNASPAKTLANVLNTYETAWNKEKVPSQNTFFWGNTQ